MRVNNTLIAIFTACWLFFTARANPGGQGVGLGSTLLGGEDNKIRAFYDDKERRLVVCFSTGADDSYYALALDNNTNQDGQSENEHWLVTSSPTEGNCPTSHSFDWLDDDGLAQNTGCQDFSYDSYGISGNLSTSSFVYVIIAVNDDSSVLNSDCSLGTSGEGTEIYPVPLLPTRLCITNTDIDESASRLNGDYQIKSIDEFRDDLGVFASKTMSTAVTGVEPYQRRDLLDGWVSVETFQSSENKNERAKFNSNSEKKMSSYWQLGQTGGAGNPVANTKISQDFTRALPQMRLVADFIPLDSTSTFNFTFTPGKCHTSTEAVFHSGYPKVYFLNDKIEIKVLAADYSDDHDDEFFSATSNGYGNYYYGIQLKSSSGPSKTDLMTNGDDVFKCTKNGQSNCWGGGAQKFDRRKRIITHTITRSSLGVTGKLRVAMCRGDCSTIDQFEEPSTEPPKMNSESFSPASIDVSTSTITCGGVLNDNDYEKRHSLTITSYDPDVLDEVFGPELSQGDVSFDGFTLCKGDTVTCSSEVAETSAGPFSESGNGYSRNIVVAEADKRKASAVTMRPTTTSSATSTVLCAATIGGGNKVGFKLEIFEGDQLQSETDWTNASLRKNATIELDNAGIRLCKGQKIRCASRASLNRGNCGNIYGDHVYSSFVTVGDLGKVPLVTYHRVLQTSVQATSLFFSCNATVESQYSQFDVKTSFEASVYNADNSIVGDTTVSRENGFFFLSDFEGKLGAGKKVGCVARTEYIVPECVDSTGGSSEFVTPSTTIPVHAPILSPALGPTDGGTNIAIYLNGGGWPGVTTQQNDQAIIFQSGASDKAYGTIVSINSSHLSILSPHWTFERGQVSVKVFHSIKMRLTGDIVCGNPTSSPFHTFTLANNNAVKCTATCVDANVATNAIALRDTRCDCFTDPGKSSFDPKYCTILCPGNRENREICGGTGAGGEMLQTFYQNGDAVVSPTNATIGTFEFTLGAINPPENVRFTWKDTLRYKADIAWNPPPGIPDDEQDDIAYTIEAEPTENAAGLETISIVTPQGANTHTLTLVANNFYFVTVKASLGTRSGMKSGQTTESRIAHKQSGDSEALDTHEEAIGDYNDKPFYALVLAGGAVNPEKPGELKAVQIKATSITMEWNTPSYSGGYPIEMYKVLVREVTEGCDTTVKLNPAHEGHEVLPSSCDSSTLVCTFTITQDTQSSALLKKQTGYRVQIHTMTKNPTGTDTKNSIAATVTITTLDELEPIVLQPGNASKLVGAVNGAGRGQSVVLTVGQFHILSPLQPRNEQVDLYGNASRSNVVLNCGRGICFETFESAEGSKVFFREISMLTIVNASLIVELSNLETILKFTHVTFYANHAKSEGAPLVLLDSGVNKIILNGVRAYNNSGTRGGFIMVKGNSKLDVISSTIESNIATNKGGAIYAAVSREENEVAPAGRPFLYISHSIFTRCKAAEGGAIYAAEGDVFLLHSNATENVARESNGGAVAVSSSYLSVIGSIFSHNSAEESGAGMAVTASTVAITDSSLERNDAKKGNGGGLFLSFSSVAMHSSKLQNNVALSSGGAIFVSSRSQLTITSCECSNNAAGENGGCLHAREIVYNGLAIYDVTMHGNNATENGGCISLDKAVKVNILQSQLLYCNAGRNGGGIFAYESSEIRLQAATVTHCSASSGGGGYFWDFPPREKPMEEAPFTSQDGTVVEDNVAMYGPDYASGPFVLMQMTGPGGSSGFEYPGYIASNTEVGKLQETETALIDEPVSFHVIDFYGQQVTSESELLVSYQAIVARSSKSWVAPYYRSNIHNETLGPPKEPKLIGVLERVSRSGIVDFDGLSIRGAPGETYEATVSTQALSYVPVKTVIALRNCTGGERWTSEGCRKCVAGFYSDAVNTIQCMLCPTGRYSTQSGKVECDVCAPGNYENEEGQTTCKDCVAGKFSSASGSERCYDCEKGKISQGLSSKCDDCAQGQYSYEGMSACSSCKSGFYNDELGSDGCKACTAGTYQDDEKQSSCESCNPGEFSKVESSMCTLCPEGKYNTANTLSGCYNCPEGRFRKKGLEIHQCSKCPEGRSSEEGSASCEACAPGKYARAGFDGCRSCIPGQFVSNAGQKECSKCPVGKVASRDGATDCILCNVSSWTEDTPGRSVCTPCKIGEVYPSSEGGGSCVACPSGRYSVLAGEPFFGCHDCPVGGVCPGGVPKPQTPAGVLLIKAGWWTGYGSKASIATTKSTVCGSNKAGSIPRQCDAVHPDCVGGKEKDTCTCRQQEEGFGEYYDYCGVKHRVYPCKFPSACVGATVGPNGTWNNLCNSEEGYTGVLCETCDEENGFFMTKQGCKSCAKETGSSIGLLVAVVVGMLCLFYLMKWLSKNIEYFDAFKGFTKTVKILGDFLQVMGTVGSVYSVIIPDTLLQFLAKLDFVSFDFVTIFGVPCLGGVDFYVNYVMTIAFPCVIIAAMAMLILYHHLQEKAVRLARLRSGAGADADGDGKIDEEDFMKVIMDKQRLEKKHRLRGDNYTKVLYILLCYLYMPISVKTFRFFQCRLIGGELYLVADYRHKCYDSRWGSYFVIAALVMVVFVFGFPAYMMRQLYKVRDNLDSIATKKSYGYMYLSYKNNAYFWEVTLLARKLFLSAAPIVLYEYPYVQLCISGMLSAMFHVYHGMYTPFRMALHNYVQHFALLATTVTFLILPLCEPNDRISLESATNAAIVVIVLNTALCIGAGLCILFMFGQGMLASNKIHKRKSVGISKRSSEQLAAWQSKLHTTKITPVLGEVDNLQAIRKQFGAGSKEYAQAMAKANKK